MAIMQSRRRFVTDLSRLAFAGATGLGGAGAVGFFGTGRTFGAEPPPETTEIRVDMGPPDCEAPKYMAEELLRAQRIIVRGVSAGAVSYLLSLAGGEYDLGFSFASAAVSALEARLPITILAGVQIGCFELYANERIQLITDLKNRTVGIRGEGLRKDLVTIIASYVGLDPANDIHWITDPTPMALFAAGKIDAFIALPPETPGI